MTPHMIHLAVPVLLAAVLAGAGVYGMLARRNAVLVLVGAELLLAAAGVLLVVAATLPATGLAGIADAAPAAPLTATDPLLPGQVATIMLITVAAAEIGLALAIVLAVFRARATSDLTKLRDLGEAAPPGIDPVAGEVAGEVANEVAGEVPNELAGTEAVTGGTTSAPATGGGAT